MKNKFIRILSPITLFIIFALDVSVICFAVFAIKKIIELHNFNSIFFAVVEILAIITAVFLTKDAFKNGAIFFDDRVEFTGLDNDNVFFYNQIESVETYQDTSASLVKNFIDRHALIIFNQIDSKVTTIDIGLTTKKTVKKIENELNKRINKNK